MDYQESRAYIQASERFGGELGLQNIRNLTEYLGNPQDSLKFIHVAGTNGKGSVIACLYSVLCESGFRVGRYTSPAVYSELEQMEVSGESITREAFASCVTRIAGAAEEMEKEGLSRPTPFEIETAAAFLYFQEQNCDLVLLETGMGGDVDATNIVKTTVLAVLASISMDHMAYLGNSLGEIAEKKAGILKAGSAMVTVRQESEARDVIMRVCRERGIPFCETDPGEATVLSDGLDGQVFSYQGEEYTLPLPGIHQRENALLALKALEILEKAGFPTSVSKRQKGLEKVRWEGRFTVLDRNPLFVLDGAHNPAAARVLRLSVEQYFPGKKLYYIMGMFRDKDYRTVLQITAPCAEKILTIAAPENPRALSPQELACAAREFHPDVQAFDEIPQAVEEAYRLAGRDGVILAFGSLAFHGVLAEIVKEGKNRDGGER
ncbi:MAG: bifunctional folylpolyglutamate synthase/dihydrofolate synthase [Clostridiales bacterium]|nr:bifunctional folylpolyglutamate synthase/dihydrofolate synthase [Clostridiales bacterium]